MTPYVKLRLAAVLLWPFLSFGQERSSEPLYVPANELFTKLISGPHAVYPPQAAAQKIEGSVRIRFVVTKEGTVEHQSFIAGDSWFVSSAEEAIHASRFHPTLVNGSPIEVVTAISLHFYQRGHSRDTYLEKYRENVAKQPDDAKAHELLAERLHETGYVAEAEQEYKSAIRLDPDFPEPHYGMSQIFRERMDFLSSIAEARKGVELRPKDQKAHLKFAGLLEDARDFDGAIAEYREGMRLGPTNVMTNYSIGLCYVLKGDPDAAIPELKTVMERLKNFSFGNYYLGRAYELKGNLPEALKQYRLALDENKNNEEIRSAYEKLRTQLKK